MYVSPTLESAWVCVCWLQPPKTHVDRPTRPRPRIGATCASARRPTHTFRRLNISAIQCSKGSSTFGEQFAPAPPCIYAEFVYKSKVNQLRPRDVSRFPPSLGQGFRNGYMGLEIILITRTRSRAEIGIGTRTTTTGPVGRSAALTSAERASANLSRRTHLFRLPGRCSDSGC